MLATALATRISWAHPFDVASAAAPGPDSPGSYAPPQTYRTPLDCTSRYRFRAARVFYPTFYPKRQPAKSRSYFSWSHCQLVQPAEVRQ